MRPCPFCAEEIQDAALKCKHCGSMLTGAVSAVSAAATAPKQVLYQGSPPWTAWFGQYVFAALLCPLLVGIVWMLLLHLRRKALRYTVTTRDVDVESGWLSKKVETIQLWRVRDIELRRSLFDRLCGVSRIRLFSDDLTDPLLEIVGTGSLREVFDQLKEAVEAMRSGRVVVQEEAAWASR